MYLETLGASLQSSIGILEQVFDNKRKIKMLDIVKLSEIERGSIFAQGVEVDNGDGLNMTNSGRSLRWIAKKGYGHNDWCIYAHFATNNINFIADYGDKVMSKENIRKLVPCTDEVFAKYRY